MNFCLRRRIFIRILGLVTGGAQLLDNAWNDPSAILNSIEIYDPSRNTWSNPEPLQHIRAEHSATLLPDGSVFVTGGYASVNAILESAEIIPMPAR